MSDVAFMDKTTLYHDGGTYSDAESLTDTSLLYSTRKHNKKSPLPFQTTDFLKSL